MKKELQFIAHCFNISYRSEAKKELENLIEKKLDWNFILEKILQNDIAPQAYHNLSGLKNKKIPDRFLGCLNKCYYYTTARNLFIEDTLYKILNLFSVENLSIIALKGIFMLDVIYESIVLRNLVDIDLLVKKNDLERIDRLLQQNDYIKFAETTGQVSYREEGNLARAELRRMPIEIHYAFDLAGPLAVSSDFLWHNPIIKDVKGLRMLYPSLENSIIYAALHVVHHFPNPPLKSILDIHEIISRNQEAVNWDYILDFCNINKARHFIYLSMFLSKLYFKTPVPEAFMNKIKPSFFRRIILQLFLSYYMDIKNFKVTRKRLVILKCIYYTLIEKSYFRERFFYPVSKFAKEHALPYPSFSALLLYVIRFFLWVNILVFF